MPKKKLTLSPELKQLIKKQFLGGYDIHEIALLHNLYPETIHDVVYDVVPDPQVAKAKSTIQKQLRYRETRRNSRRGIR